MNPIADCIESGHLGVVLKNFSLQQVQNFLPKESQVVADVLAVLL
jgi:hypothetical protein